MEYPVHVVFDIKIVVFFKIVEYRERHHIIVEIYIVIPYDYMLRNVAPRFYEIVRVARFAGSRVCIRRSAVSRHKTQFDYNVVGGAQIFRRFVGIVVCQRRYVVVGKLLFYLCRQPVDKSKD